jgi:hypothetical protein
MDDEDKLRGYQLSVSQGKGLLGLSDSLRGLNRPLPVPLTSHHAQAFFNRQRPHLKKGGDLGTA